MPYLNRVESGKALAPLHASQRPGPGDIRLGLGVPGYAHPLVAPMEWGELTRAGSAVHWAVLNVANGPGARPDPHCLEAAGRLRAAGVKVLGQLDLRWARRPFGELITDAHRFLEWYKADGFYLDRCPTERSLLQEVRRTTTTLGALSDDAHIVLGHGTHPYPGYAEAADQLVTFAGPWTEYRWSQVAEWTADYPAEKFCHLVHGIPRMHLTEAMRIARWQGAASVFFTDRRSWEALPGYWDEIVSRIGQGVSE
ncbi:spherulation-specific family 4 protein [Streptomyces coryli]